MKAQASRPSPRAYLILLGLWLAGSLAVSLFGAAAGGWGSVVPNFLTYGLGVGSGIALLLAVAYFLDVRLHAKQSPRDR